VGRRQPTIEKFAAGIANEAAALPWHWSQFASCSERRHGSPSASAGPEKSVPVWQLVQVAVVAVGMWFAGFSTPSK